MDKNYIISRLLDIIENGDMGRNQYLLKQINKNNPIFESDKKYLKRILKLELDINEIYKIEKNKTMNIPQKDKSVFLNSNLIKCTLCNNDIQLNESKPINCL